MLDKKEMAKLLISSGADVNLKNGRKETALHLFLGKEDLGIQKALIEAGADVDVKDKYGEPLLLSATSGGRTEFVRLLVNSGADIDATDNIGITALHIAAYYGHREIARILKDAGADPNVQDTLQRTPLTIASQIEGSHEIAEMLSEGEAKSSKGPSEKDHELIDAVRYHKVEEVKKLLADGADANVRDKFDHDKTPLIQVSSFGTTYLPEIEKQRAEIALMLIKAGADVNAECDGNTPLTEACLNGHTGVVKVLVENDADVNQAGSRGITPLMLAAVGVVPDGAESTEIARILLEAGAEPDAMAHESETRRTSLIIAAMVGGTDMVELLLEYGADPSVRNKDGKTARMLAEDTGYPKTAEVLEAAEKGRVRTWKTLSNKIRRVYAQQISAVTGKEEDEEFESEKARELGFGIIRNLRKAMAENGTECVPLQEYAEELAIGNEIRMPENSSYIGFRSEGDTRLARLELEFELRRSGKVSVKMNVTVMPDPIRERGEMDSALKKKIEESGFAMRAFGYTREHVMTYFRTAYASKSLSRGDDKSVWGDS